MHLAIGWLQPQCHGVPRARDVLVNLRERLKQIGDGTPAACGTGIGATDHHEGFGAEVGSLAHEGCGECHRPLARLALGAQARPGPHDR
ncbi:unannotated protein [freshwater metagenome]|uniref:Unannotated protein n=1 Tax=freshwater metagenome TaxID=449393 RepID=A0A6J7C4P2_9ZZZZ